jgi:hypothetical protein
MNYIIDNCIVSEYMGGIRIMKNKHTNNYNKLDFGSRLFDNHIISLLSDGHIGINDLTNDSLIKKYIDTYKNQYDNDKNDN